MLLNHLISDLAHRNLQDLEISRAVGDEREGRVAELESREAGEGAFAATDELPDSRVNEVRGAVRPAAPLLDVDVGPAVGASYSLQPGPAHQP